MCITNEKSGYIIRGGVHISADKNDKGSSWYRMFIQYFPRRIFLLDMAIPLLSYSILANCGNPLVGIVFAGLWSIVRVIWKSARHKKVSVFAVITMIFAAVEFAAFYISNNLYWLSLGIRSGLYGLLVTLTLVFRKSFIEIMVEESKTTNFTEEFKRTKPYRNCWKLVTVIWGMTYMIKGFFYEYFAPQLDLGIAFTLRVILGWPLTIVLIAFSIWFPHKYWDREREKGNISVPIIHRS